MLKSKPSASALAALMIASVLSGCGGGNAERPNAPTKVSSAAPTTADPVAEAAAAAEALAAEAAAKVARLESIDCDGATFDALAAAWVKPHEMCEVTMAGEDFTAVQSKALKTAYPETGDLESLGVLYSICAQNGPAAFAYMRDGDSPGQVSEVAGAMLLCPKHPNRALIGKYLAIGKINAQLIADGRIFGSGTFLVGKEIKSGTYFVTDADGCYWERTNRNGATIDNYFTNGARRVQVTIRSSDYSFNSERCGEWHPVG